MRPLSLVAAFLAGSSLAAAGAAPVDRLRIQESFGRLPMRFEAHAGKGAGNARFLARGAGYSLALGARGVTLTLKDAALSMRFVGARTSLSMEGLDPLEGASNYFTGRDPKQWRRGVRAFGKVRYQGIYPGVDLIFYGNQRKMEYDLIAAPGADLSRIRFRVSGAESVRLNPQGDLLLGLPGGEVSWQKPTVYQQDKAGGRRVVEGRYAMLADGSVGFEVRGHDPSLAVVIDPVLEYATYYGGSSSDAANAIALDAQGNAYIAGSSYSTSLPGTVGAGHKGSPGDAFVAKINAGGSSVGWLAYLGGKYTDTAWGVALDPSGNVYVAGESGSPDFPVTTGAYQTAAPTSTGAFVAKLNSSGSTLLYSTFVGGRGADYSQVSESRAYAIAVDSQGNAYITGRAAANFPTTAGAAQTAHAGNNDAFVAKLNSTGSSLLYATYLGGSGPDEGKGIAVDSAGSAYVTGDTWSVNFPTRNPLQAAHASVPLTRTVNGGGSWTPALTGLSATALWSLAIDPKTPTTLYAGTYYGGVFKSTDGGSTWTQRNGGMTSTLALYAFAISPSNPQIVYAADVMDMYRSADGGGTWTKLPSLSLAPSPSGYLSLSGRVASLAVHPTNPAILYVALNSSSGYTCLLKTTDSGANWAISDTGISKQDLAALVMDPQNPSTLYAAASTAIFKTTDSGAHWNAVGSGLSSTTIYGLSIDPASPSTLYVAGGGGGGIFKSTDGGATFAASGTGFDNYSVNTIAVAPNTPSTLYATGSYGVYKSVDGGAHWSSAATGLNAWNYNYIVVDPSNANRVWLGGYHAEDVFVAKIAPGGGSITASTYLGGAGRDAANAIAIDGAGNAYITGYTTSVNFPTTANLTGGSAYDGSSSFFVAKVDLGGARLGYSGVFGGGTGYGIAVDPSGSAWAVGKGWYGFPQTGAGFQPGYGYSGDGVVVKMNSSGSAADFASYLGGSDSDVLNAVALDGQGSVYVAGQTSSNDIQIVPGAAQAAKASGSDVYVAKISPAAAGGPVAIGAGVLDFTATAGGASTSKTVDVTSTGGSTTFTAASNAAWLSVTPGSGSTPATLTITVNPSGLAAGPYSGKITVTGGGATVYINVSVTVNPVGAAVPLISSVVHGGSYGARIAPASWITIYGANLAPTTRVWRGDEIIDGALPKQLDGVSAKVNGKDAYVYFISPGQVNVQAPDDATEGTVQVVVTNGGVSSASYAATMGQTAPGFFLFPGGYIAARHADYRILAPTTLFSGCPSAAECPIDEAKPDETILLYGTGFGPTNPALAAGRIGGGFLMTQAVRVKFGSIWVDAAGAISGAGLWQINVKVPSSLPDGDVTVIAEVAGQQTQTGAKIAIKR
jgi:uncharacterized protein (TIGR03437 family)